MLHKTHAVLLVAVGSGKAILSIVSCGLHVHFGMHATQHACHQPCPCGMSGAVLEGFIHALYDEDDMPRYNAGDVDEAIPKAASLPKSQGERVALSTSMSIA